MHDLFQEMSSGDSNEESKNSETGISENINFNGRSLLT
jgi:hypothetical protein